MKTKSFLMMALATVVAFAACNKDPEPKPNPKPTPGATPEVSIEGTAVGAVKVKLSAINPTAAVQVVLQSSNAAQLAVTSPVTIAKGQREANVTITPASDLAAGTYEATITIKSATGATVSKTAASTTVSYTKSDGGQGGGDTPNPPTPTYDLTEETVSCFIDANDCTAWYKFSGNKITLTGGYTVVIHALAETLNGQQRLCNFGDTNEAPCHMLRFGQRSNKAELELSIDNPNSSNRLNLYFEPVTAGVWNQFAIAVKEEGGSKTIQLFVNGAACTDPQAFNGASGFDFAAFEFGNSWGTSYQSVFDGSIAYVSVWDKALTADEVAAVYKKRPAATADGLKAFWAMTDGSGSKLASSVEGVEDIDLTKCTRCDDETNYVDKDLSGLIQWRTKTAPAAQE